MNACAAAHRDRSLAALGRSEFEEAYREASGHGWEPQPGFALMRLAQGRVEAAEAAMAVSAHAGPTGN